MTCASTTFFSAFLRAAFATAAFSPEVRVFLPLVACRNTDLCREKVKTCQELARFARAITASSRGVPWQAGIRAPCSSSLPPELLVLLELDGDALASSAAAFFLPPLAALFAPLAGAGGSCSPSAGSCFAAAATGCGLLRRVIL